ncbi:cache domain-containing protein [uncultured Thiodictyon sp.]|uniref:cache domain-containing protein n=1 Tax=uncultured Thiodictyon sp. TaxID=1846217 RepID=UPI0025EA7591|nr:cache domain-containing protein [uncultured Thiodictyon sp.]
MSFKLRILLLTILPLLLMAGVIGVGWWMSAGLAETQSHLFRDRLVEARRAELRRLLDLGRSAIAPILKEAALHPEADPASAQAEAKRVLTELRFEGNGYFYLYDAKGVVLAHPIRPEWVGKNRLNHRDSRGCYVIRELLGVAARGGGRTFEDQDRLGCYVLAALNQTDPGGGFLRYRWENPSTGREEEKLGVVELLPAWGWMLGTGLYYDNINEDVDLWLDRVRRNIGHTFTLLLVVLGLTTLVAAVLVLLTNLYQGRLVDRHLQALVYHYITLQIEERRRLSRNLHDNVNPSIVAAKYRIETALSQAAQGKPEYRENLVGALETLDTAIAEVRSVSHDLRPGVLDDLGLEPGLKDQLDEFGKRTGIVSSLTYSWDRPPLGEIVETYLYRVVQQALMNIEAHARASHVSLDLRPVGQSVRLEVKDDGRGFDPAHPSADPGIGLRTMRERFELLGGQFRIDSAPGRGTLIQGEIPIQKR